MNSSFRRSATTDQTLRSGNLSTRLNIRANKTCIYLEQTLRNHLHRKKLLPLLSNLHLKDFYNKQRRRWKKNKREDERQKENFLFGFFYYLVEYEAARFVDHKQIVDSRCHFCHKTTRELLLLLLPPRETIANATSEQSTKASGSGTRGSPNPNLLNPNFSLEFIIFMIIICEIKFILNMK
jgi:hypothetical protein